MTRQLPEWLARFLNFPGRIDPKLLMIHLTPCPKGSRMKNSLITDVKGKIFR